MLYSARLSAPAWQKSLRQNTKPKGITTMLNFSLAQEIVPS